MLYNKETVHPIIYTNFIPTLTNTRNRVLCMSTQDVEKLGQAAIKRDKESCQKIFYYLGPDGVEEENYYELLQNFIYKAVRELLYKGPSCISVDSRCRTFEIDAEELASLSGYNIFSWQGLHVYRKKLDKLTRFCICFFCYQPRGFDKKHGDSSTERGYSSIKLAEDCVVVKVSGKDYIRITFELTFTKAVFQNMPITFIPLALYAIPYRQRNTRNILNLLAQHWHMSANHGKAQEGKELYAKLQVKNMLLVTDLKTYQELSDSAQAKWKDYIKTPFEKMLNYLTEFDNNTGCPPIKTWDYVVWEPGEWEDEAGVKHSGKDRYIKPSELKKYSYAEWSRLNIKITSDAFVPHENYLQHAQEKKNDYVRSKIIAAKRSGKAKAKKRKTMPDPGPRKTEEDILASIADSQK